MKKHGRGKALEAERRLRAHSNRSERAALHYATYRKRCHWWRCQPASNSCQGGAARTLPICARSDAVHEQSVKQSRLDCDPLFRQRGVALSSSLGKGSTNAHLGCLACITQYLLREPTPVVY